MQLRQRLVAFILVVAFAVMACAPLDLAVEIAGLIATASVTATPTQTNTPTATPDLETLDWYVAPDGNDSNTCMTPSDPCEHLAATVAKSTPSDHIHMAAGTFHATGAIFTYIPHNLTITGEGIGVTILNGEGSVGGIRVSGSAELTLEGVTIRETGLRSAYACLYVADTATARLTNVRLRQCERQAAWVAPGATLFMTNVEIHETVDEDTNPDFIVNGYGLFNEGTTHMEGGSIHHNAREGVYNSGDLNFSNVDIYQNATSGVSTFGGTAVFNGVNVYQNGTSLPGGGFNISDGAVVMVYDSDIYNNSESGFSVNSGGQLSLVRSTVRDHQRIGLAVRASSSAEVENSTIENNNRAGGWGFAVINEGELILSASHIINNNDGLGVYAIGAATTELYDSEVVNHDERGVYNQDAAGVLILERVLIAQNQTGLTSYGDLTMENVTVSQNEGTGVVVGGTADIAYSTIADNGDGFVGGGSSISIANTIFAGNTRDCTGPLTSSTLSGVNIDTDGLCDVTTYTASELALGGLSDNGGFTRTHALGTDSVAIDAATGACPASDQRGLGFARPAGPGCDVGAYEAGAAAPTPAAIVQSSETPTITPTLQSLESIDVVVITNARCRKGPDPIFPDHDFFAAGDQSVLTGRSYDGNWFLIQALNNLGTCWIARNVLEVQVADEVLMSLPAIVSPPTPTFTPQPTNTPKPTATPCSPNDNCSKP